MTQSAQASLPVGFFQEMPGKDRQAIEQPFAHAVSLRQLKDDGIRVYLAHAYRFSANNQEIALRSVHVSSR